MSENVAEEQGKFYLGRHHDLKSGVTSDQGVFYKAKDLTTHAMVVGMTGSGKTGLCLDLLEEAGIDGIPAIIVDPKGDIANLLLTFPELAPEDFEPWVDEAEAKRRNLSPEEFATKEAEKWKAGLASWGQSPQRIKDFRSRVNLSVFTPGSNQGRPLSILRSFDVPPAEVMDDAEAFGDYVAAAVSGLLGLLKIDSDPATSRPHILLSKILHDQWAAGRSLRLDELVKLIFNPPFTQVGALDLDSFLSEKERTDLGMSVNNLIASPAFADWRKGEPLDIQRLLYDDSGKPNISILSISHLDDGERMFFVTLLLNEIVAWVRKQSGTSSLRAIFYMDEVFGYFPPVANPPSKQPMLTLLKQARAFGLGVVLATQNPVDLDYKGLSNMGTWFLGRLQTERDKARVLEGLEGAAANSGNAFDASEMDQVLAGLGARKFLMNNVHDDGQTIFETRWALSYLRGPIAPSQLKELNQKHGCEYQEWTEEEVKTKNVGVVLPAGIEEKFVTANSQPAGSTIVYNPAIVATATAKYKNPKASSKSDSLSLFQYVFLSDLLPNNSWEKGRDATGLNFGTQLPASKQRPLPTEVADPKNYKLWQEKVEQQLLTQKKIVYFCPEIKAASEVLEPENDGLAFAEQILADLQKDRKSDLEDDLEKAEAKVRKAEVKLEKEKNQVSQRWWDVLLSFGTAIMNMVMSALSGRKVTTVTNTRSMGSAMKKASRVSADKADVELAEEELKKAQEDRDEIKDQLADIEAMKPADIQLEKLTVEPSSIDVDDIEGIIWLPFAVDSSGFSEAIF